MITVSARYTGDAQSLLIEWKKKERVKEGMECAEDEGLYLCDRKITQM